MSDRSRHTPLIVARPLDQDAELALLAEMDRDTAQLAGSSLTRAANELRQTPPWRPLRRSALQRTIRCQRQALVDLGVTDLPPVTASPREQRRLERRETRAARVRRRKSWRSDRYDAWRWWWRRHGFTVAMSSIVVGFAVGMIALVIGSAPNAAEEAAQRRENLEVFARAQERYANAHDGNYTDDVSELRDMVKSSSDTDSVLYNMADDIDLVISDDGYDVAYMDSPRFSLRAEGETVQGLCSAPVEQGCRSGQWTPTALNP